MKSSLIALGLLAACSTASMAEEYYIVYGPDRHCRVIERRPVDRTIVQIGPFAFQTRDEAERELRVRCRDGYFREGAIIEERRERIR